MLLCDKIDLDLEDEAEVYKNAQETIAYLNNVVSSISQRVLEGEKIQGFKIVDGRASRQITQGGYEYIKTHFGEDKAYETITKPLTLTKIEVLIGKVETKSMETLGLIIKVPGSPKVVLDEEGEENE